ncbi:hypothetical protein ACJX0J_036090 [Zea mays]
MNVRAHFKRIGMFKFELNPFFFETMEWIKLCDNKFQNFDAYFSAVIFTEIKKKEIKKERTLSSSTSKEGPVILASASASAGGKAGSRDAVHVFVFGLAVAKLTLAGNIIEFIMMGKRKPVEFI